jgi:hypothetical protein
MESNAVVRWHRAHPIAWRVLSAVTGAGFFVFLWFVGAGTIALACGVVFVIAEAFSLGALLLRRQMQRSGRA